jgi:hypothetical protein
VSSPSGTQKGVPLRQPGVHVAFHRRFGRAPRPITLSAQEAR